MATESELCFGAILGPSIAEQRVAATSDTPVRFDVPADGCEHVLLTRGTFQFSKTGVQDALRRWHEPLEDLDPSCVSCELTPQEANVSYVVDGDARRPLLECPFQNAYVHLVPADVGDFEVAIHDAAFSAVDPYADNSGGLTVSLHRVPRTWTPLARDAAGLRLGSPIGDWVGGTWAGVEPLGDDLTALLVAAKLLHANPFDLITFTAPELLSQASESDEFLVEVSGLAALGGGFELDPGNTWDHQHKSWKELAIPAVDFEPCRRVAQIGDPFAHRYLYRVTGCEHGLMASLTRTDFIGRFRVDAWRTR
ncbi:MAG: hypothetical protein H6744_02945 [Deltaproteobacteria bacterium]|nr:hypothetical protein [Deltaproteobacteria bacterium]MCB9785631.1 hypothetical protein [Deltaproteobacteria bacterium]